MTPWDVSPRSPMPIEPLQEKGGGWTIFVCAVLCWLVPLSLVLYWTRPTVRADASHQPALALRAAPVNSRDASRIDQAQSFSAPAASTASGPTTSAAAGPDQGVTK